VTADPEELAYHVRELRTDLGLVRAALEHGTESDARSVRRAWVQAAALLEHDLDVHVAQALRLLGVAVRSGDRVPEGEATGALAEAAEIIVRHVGAALAALGDAPCPNAAQIIAARRELDTAHGLAADSLDRVD
jgi:hypothetical protein